jgi:hypothetical protein
MVIRQVKKRVALAKHSAATVAVFRLLQRFDRNVDDQLPADDGNDDSDAAGRRLTNVPATTRGRCTRTRKSAHSWHVRLSASPGSKSFSSKGALMKRINQTDMSRFSRNCVQQFGTTEATSGGQDERGGRTSLVGKNRSSNSQKNGVESTADGKCKRNFRLISTGRRFAGPV